MQQNCYDKLPSLRCPHVQRDKKYLNCKRTTLASPTPRTRTAALIINGYDDDRRALDAASPPWIANRPRFASANPHEKLCRDASTIARYDILQPLRLAVVKKSISPLPTTSNRGSRRQKTRFGGKRYESGVGFCEIAAVRRPGAKTAPKTPKNALFAGRKANRTRRTKRGGGAARAEKFSVRRRRRRATPDTG